MTRTRALLPICACSALVAICTTPSALADDVLSKIERLASVMASWSPHPLVLHLVPAFPYEARAVGVVQDAYDMVLFRRYMVKTAARFARRENCLALVTGDSVGQVASQTLHNLRAIAPDLTLPVLRPLVGLDTPPYDVAPAARGDADHVRRRDQPARVAVAGPHRL